MRRWMAAAVVLVLAGCAAGDDTPAAAPATGIAVGSFDFVESRLLAEIYAQALEDEGVEVRRELGLGPRELVMPALRQGFVDVVPEYAGSALDAVSPRSSADRSDLAAVVAALDEAVTAWGLDVLSPSMAANQNALAVTSELAGRRSFRTISDLAPAASSLTIGGPPECPVRERCLVGLETVYDLSFASFVPLPRQELVRRALEDGVIDVGVLFTTDAALAGESLVVLEDDRRLQPAENVVALVRSAGVDRRAAAALDEVAAALTTTNLRFLNWRVAHAGTTVAAEARGWLLRRGLIRR